MKKLILFFVMAVLLVFAGDSLSKSNATQAKILEASDGMSGDGFGFSAAVHSRTIVVGAHASDPLGTNSGKAYVFKRIAGQWIQQAILVPSDGAEHAWFGWSVAVDKRTIAVGAYGRFKKVSAGAVYIFRRYGSAWMEEAKLTSSDAAKNDHFGYAVALSGKTLVVGATGNDDAGTLSGSAYVFRRINGTWIEQAKLTASDAAARNQFGKCVSTSGKFIVVGGGNKAYVFHYEGGNWIEEAKLESTGNAVALSGKTLVTGQLGATGTIFRSGLAYVFERRGGKWIMQATLSAGDASSLAHFGESVSIDGDAIVISAPRDAHAGSFSGAVYLFRYQDGEWIQTNKFTAPSARPSDWFGNSVGIDGGSIVVGAQSYDGAAINAGAAFVFNFK